MYKTLKNKNIIKFIIPLFLFAFVSSGTMFYVSFINIIYREYGVDPLKISLLLVVRNIAQLSFDIPAGVLADRFGVKKMVILSKLLQGLAVLCLLKQGMIFFTLASAFLGFSVSCFYGKIETFIYNYLSSQKQSHEFPKIVSLNTFVSNIARGLSCIFAGILFTKGGVNYVLYATFFGIIFSLLSLIPVPHVEGLMKKQSRMFLSAFSGVKTILKSNRMVFILMMFYAVTFNFYTNFNNMSELIALDMGFSKIFAANMFGINLITVGVGSFVVSMLPNAKISSSRAIKIFNLSFFIVLCSVPFYNASLFIAIILYKAMYPFVQIGLESDIERIAVPEARATTMSIATTLSYIIAIITTLIFGFVAKMYSYKVSFMIIISLCFIPAIIAQFYVENMKRKGKSIVK